MRKSNLGRTLSSRAFHIVAVSLLLSNLSPLRAAEYKGRSLDGALLDATVLNLDTGWRYKVKIDFDEDHAVVLFPPCIRVLLTLDSEKITDPQKIPAFDVEQDVHWEISIDADSLNPDTGLLRLY
jgi:hypothetical protein